MKSTQGCASEHLKQIVPITEVVGRYVDLHCTGTTCAGLCPFHKEEVASFTVYPETGTYYCFGCAAAARCASYRRVSFDLVDSHGSTLSFGRRSLARKQNGQRMS